MQPITCLVVAIFLFGIAIQGMISVKDIQALKISLHFILHDRSTRFTIAPRFIWLLRESLVCDVCYGQHLFQRPVAIGCLQCLLDVAI